MMPFAAVALLVQVAVPPPQGYVNDFAGVVDARSAAHMTAVIQELRAKTRGEIAVATLADIGDRPASEVALQIGRAWGVGAQGAAGDAAKNAGVVVLLVPLQNHRPGTGQIFIATGRGAEGFLPDSRIGRIRDAMTPYFAREDYGAGLALGVDLLAQAFAAEFGVTFDSVAAAPPDGGVGMPRIPRLWIILFVVFLILVSRGRILWLPFLFSGMGRSRRGGGWGGWSGGGGRGGGFGGFGGGGGFSGGGAGGRF